MGKKKVDKDQLEFFKEIYGPSKKSNKIPFRHSKAPEIRNKLPEGVTPFIHINQNDSPWQKPIRQKVDDIALCECKYEANYSDSSCGESCLNLLTSTECTPGYCLCGDKCKNQRFQKHEYARAKLFKTEGRGWGLLADEHIKAGQFIIEYCGEIISWEEAKQRFQAYEAQGLRDSYIISLDAKYFIDATKKGSFARFINHSCQPNCKTEKWIVLGETRVGIFAKQDISAGTELVYDYNFEWYGGANVLCLCGSSNCSTFLGAKSHGFQEHNRIWEDGDDRYMLDTLPLYDSAGDEPSSKYAESANFFKFEYIDYGKKDDSVITDGAVGSDNPFDSTTLIVEPLNSVPMEGETVDTQQEFPQMDASLNCNIWSGNASNKRSARNVPMSRSKRAGKKHVNGKTVAKLFASKEAQEEIIRCEEVRTEATKKLNSVYEILPVIEDNAKDSQDKVPTGIAEK